MQKLIHRTTLFLRQYTPFRWAADAFYSFAIWIFIRSVCRLNRKFATPPVRSIYLRRGGGREEFVPGASDIDFFLVLHDLDSAAEMDLLKKFWTAFRFWKKFFPFLGETLMADQNELANWSGTPTVRAFEAQFSWKLLWGEPVLENLPPSPLPELRDVLSESMKAYWALCRPVLHESLDPLSPTELRALAFRHAAKAAVDLFRMHYSFAGGETPALQALWKAGRAEALDLLPKETYGDLEPLKALLHLRGPLPADLFGLFGGIIFRAYFCLDDISLKLAAEAGERAIHFQPYAAKKSFGKEKIYSYVVRELFTERMLLRHSSHLRRTLTSGETTHIFFPLHVNPSAEKMNEILRDLHDAGRSFDQSSVAIVLSERTLQELERTSFLDSPFHAFHDHQRSERGEDGHIHSSPYVSRAQSLPARMLEKTFAEVSLSLRFQPPPEFSFVIEHLINLVLQLRVAHEHGLIATDFQGALEKYSERHPVRGAYLKEKVGAYMNLIDEKEDQFWLDTISSIDRFAQKDPQRASMIRAQLEGIRNQKTNPTASSTDLWMELTPFLRLEMNTMRDHFFRQKTKLKL